MANEPKKKRTCAICGTEHTVGEACPSCEWDQEAEEKRAKGELERERIRDEIRKGKSKKTGSFWG